MVARSSDWMRATRCSPSYCCERARNRCRVMEPTETEESALRCEVVARAYWCHIRAEATRLPSVRPTLHQRLQCSMSSSGRFTWLSYYRLPPVAPPFRNSRWSTQSSRSRSKTGRGISRPQPSAAAAPASQVPTARPNGSLNAFERSASSRPATTEHICSPYLSRVAESRPRRASWRGAIPSASAVTSPS